MFWLKPLKTKKAWTSFVKIAKEYGVNSKQVQVFLFTYLSEQTAEETENFMAYVSLLQSLCLSGIDLVIALRFFENKAFVGCENIIKDLWFKIATIDASSTSTFEPEYVSTLLRELANQLDMLLLEKPIVLH